MDILLQELAMQGIERLSDSFGNSSCNDLILADSPRLQRIWEEYNAWNLNVPLDKLDKSDDQYQPYPTPHLKDGIPVVCLHDSLIIFALKYAVLNINSSK